MELSIPAMIVAPPAIAIFSAATTDSSGSVNIPNLVGTVVTPAIVIILLLMGKLRTEPEVKRLEESNKTMRETIVEKDKQMQALQEGLVDKAIPALTRSTLVLETLSPILQAELHQRRQTGGG